MDKKVLIYGGSGGIGAATARILKSNGFALHLVGRTEAKLSALADELSAGYTVGDVRDDNLYSRVAEEVGSPLDGLIYAVGTLNLGSLRRLSADNFLDDLHVNAVGAALAVQSSLPALKKSKDIASVVLFSSVAALQGFALHASMGMAKGAVGGLTLSLAAELAPKVRVNAIAPGLTQTPLAGSILRNEKITEGIASMHALPRLGTPEDMAALAVFFDIRRS